MNTYGLLANDIGLLSVFRFAQTAKEAAKRDLKISSRHYALKKQNKRVEKDTRKCQLS
jgi:hypothetical protein